MHINGVLIDDTFAEAFPMAYSKLIITADSPSLARQAAQAAAGMAISIIGCSCESGLGEALDPAVTPDARPGQVLWLYSYSAEKLEEQLFFRIGQAILPSATSACFNGLESTLTCKPGAKLRYFGDGFQSSKLLDGKRFWRIPVADGEFVLDESFGIGDGVGGGNLLLMGTDRKTALEAAEASVEAILQVPGAIAPFPGGICRSPSKPKGKYANVPASTNAGFCPTLRSRVETRLTPDAHAVYELVIDGESLACVTAAMAAAIRAACRPGITQITAGNYGGKWGKYHIYLHQILRENPA